MQKKIIALAIASALTVPALAFAEASISGQANMSIDNYNDGAATSASAWQMSSNQSRIIVKGSDDLGGGLSAMWQVDARFSLDTGRANGDTGGNANVRLFDGNNYVGVKSDGMGTLTLGRNDTPYKSSTRKLDVFFDVAGDNRGTLGGGMGGHDSRYDNALNYTSPNFSGITIGYSTVFGGETPVANSTKGSLMSLAAMYEQGPIYATIAIDNKKLGTPGTGDLAGAAAANVGDTDNAFKLAGSYKQDAIAASLIYEKQTTKPAATGVETTQANLYLAGKFNISSTDAVRAAYTKHGASKSGGATGTDDATHLAIGYEHGMSKATSVYATYAKKTTNSAVNVNPSVLSFGMKHAF